MRGTTAVALGGLAVWLAMPSAAALAQQAGSSVDRDAQHAVQPEQPSTVNGTFEIEVTLQVSPSLPDGSTITVEATASTFDSIYSDSVSLTGTTTSSGGQASLTLNIPYTWLVESTSDDVEITVYITGSAATNTASYFNSSDWSETIALPANGATTQVQVSTTL